MHTHPQRPAVRRHGSLDAVEQARDVVLVAGVADLTRYRTFRDRTTGPAPRRGDYNTLGLLTVSAWVLLSGKADTTGNTFDAIWSYDGLTDGEMTFIGLGDLRRTNDRFRKINANVAAWNAEHARLHELRRGLHVRRDALRRALLEPAADTSVD